VSFPPREAGGISPSGPAGTRPRGILDNNLLRLGEFLPTITSAMNTYWRYFWFSFTDAAFFGRWRRAGGRA
jgi:hypothetical protein